MAQPKPPTAVKVRLLVACAHGPADAVVTLPAADVAHLQAQGVCDPHKDAVAYAMTLPQNTAL